MKKSLQTLFLGAALGLASCAAPGGNAPGGDQVTVYVADASGGA